MTFTKITTSQTCHICEKQTAEFSNDSGILFCGDCRNEAAAMKRGRKFKPGQPVNVRIPADDIQRLKQLSAESGRSFNHLVTIAIKSFLKREAVK